MELVKYETLISSIDLGSFTKASELLGYTPSGISHMMNHLEDELGFPLLLRSKTGVVPTRECERLLPTLREIVRQNKQLNQLTSEICGLTTGTLTLATYSSMANHLLPNIIKRFRKDYPGIHIQLIEGVWEEVNQLLCRHQADLGFFSLQKPMNHTFIPLVQDEMLAVVPGNHKLSSRSYVTLAELEKEPFIMPALGCDNDVMELIRKTGFHPNVTFTTQENYSTMSMIECGLGISIMNEMITLHRTSDVKKLPLKPRQFISLGIAIPDKKSMSPAANKFLEYALL